MKTDDTAPMATTWFRKDVWKQESQGYRMIVCSKMYLYIFVSSLTAEVLKITTSFRDLESSYKIQINYLMLAGERK